MKRYGIIHSIKNLFETIKPMPMKEKVNHILTSYTDVVFLLGVVLVLLSMLVTSLIFSGPETVFEGAVFNVKLSSEGVDDISNDFAQLLEPEMDNKAVTVNKYAFQNVSVPEGDEFESVEDMQNATQIMVLMKQIAMLVSAKEIDFMMADRSSMVILKNQDFCMNLSQLLPEDVFTRVKDQLIYMESIDDGSLIPLAIDISGTAFAKKYISSENTCIAFVGNTTRPDKCLLFLDYILNWSEETNN